MAKSMNYRQIAAMLSSGNYKDFQGNSMSGRWVYIGRIAPSGKVVDEYRVYSYRTLIARYNTEEGWHFNSHKYSVTTSKQQGYLRASCTPSGFFDWQEAKQYAL